MLDSESNCADFANDAEQTLARTRERAMIFALRTAKIGEDCDDVLSRAKQYEGYLRAA